MKAKNIKYILTAAIAIIFSGCSKDYLDVDPKGSKLEGNFYQAAEDAFGLSLHNPPR